MEDEMRKFTATLNGRVLLMHNSQLSDPLNEWVKEIRKITDKGSKKMGDADHHEKSRLEFQGGLWYDDDGLGPIIPGDAINAMLVEGARKQRRGVDFEASVFCDEAMFPLEYDGPRDREGLWNAGKFVDRRSAGIKDSRIMRTRPKFRDWSVTISFVVTDHSINTPEIKKALDDAGQRIGIGDWRPRFGTFTVTEFAEVT
jgi:hypothetical protein